MLLPTNVSANAGLPMFAYGYPFMIALFIPVLLMEIVVYKLKLRKSIWDIFKVAGLANLYTTMIGYPISWFLLFLYQLIISVIGLLLFQVLELVISLDFLENQSLEFFSIPFVMPAWLVPYYPYNYAPMDLIICLAGMVGLIPAYYVTISTEKRILKRYWKDEGTIDSACVMANRVSYLFLYLIVIGDYFYFLLL